MVGTPLLPGTEEAYLEGKGVLRTILLLYF
jgi:hypothetical protein